MPTQNFNQIIFRIQNLIENGVYEFHLQRRPLHQLHNILDIFPFLLVLRAVPVVQGIQAGHHCLEVLGGLADPLDRVALHLHLIQVIQAGQVVQEAQHLLKIILWTGYDWLRLCWCSWFSRWSRLSRWTGRSRRSFRPRFSIWRILPLLTRLSRCSSITRWTCRAWGSGRTCWARLTWRL
uniref:Uncharacterized protein n=1 Tax=Meloidogyne incognita TaxID=6306 RepID=A0A914MHX8_MELIC